MRLLYYITLLSLRIFLINCNESDECIKEGILSKEKLSLLSKQIVPELNKKSKGESGRIGIIGGSVEYTGAPYFAALTALKVGADLVYVITTEEASSVIKSYSPDLIVYPYLSRKYSSKISQLLHKMEVVVLGPGLGRGDEEIKLALDIMQACKNLKKPMVIDADGLYALTTNVSILNDYPMPGVILTPNKRESLLLQEAIKSNDTKQWYTHWGENISILIKGFEDTCYSSIPKFNWSLLGGGSGRRTAGQGDILAGALGTLYNWSLKANLCNNEQSSQLAQSVAIYAAAKLTRTCNAHAFEENGRNLIASDMLTKIHSAFIEVF